MNQKKENRRFVYRTIRPFIKRLQGLIIALGVVKVFLLAGTLINPYFFKLLIDDVMIAHKLEMLLWVCLGYSGVYVLETLLFVFQRKIMNTLFQRLLFTIRRKLWGKYTRMPLSFFEQYSSADLKVRIDTDIDEFEKFISLHFIEYFYSWALCCVTGIVLLYLNWKLAAFGFLMVPVSFWMTQRLGKGAKNTQEMYRKTFGNYEEWLKESIQGWREVKALSIEKHQQRIFTRYWHTLCVQFFKRQMFWWGNRTFIGVKDFFITRMNLYFIGGLLILNGELTVGALLVFMKYYEQFFSGLGTINNLDMQLQTEIPNMKRTIEVLEYPEPALPAKRNFQATGAIDYQHIHFAYNTSHSSVLKDIHFTVNTHEKVAIVGRSGCGKSTLLKLLLGLYEPSEGHILLDGMDLTAIHPEELRANIGSVMQDSTLFNMTIRENFLLAKPQATNAELEEACNRAYIHHFIERLPEKYNTRIGEKGLKLSGGQRQRLAIARVMLTQPKIIVFDEATSSLDHDSEKMIHHALEEISKERTVLIVAHRLSSVLTADRVLVMDAGQIVGQGTHKELLDSSEYYQALFKPQYREVI